MEAKTESFIFAALNLIVVFVGTVGNVRFLIKNKGFRRGTEKAADIKLIASIVALFNILHLLCKVPQIYFNVAEPDKNLFCVIFKYFYHLTKFSVYFSVGLLSKHCYVLSNDDHDRNKSNRRQMLIEVLIIWIIHIILLVALELTLLINTVQEHCSSEHLRLLREPVLLIFTVLTLIFVILTWHRARQLNHSSVAIIKKHFVCQSRKVCLLYSFCWIPLFAFSVLRWFGVFGMFGNDDMTDSARHAIAVMSLLFYLIQTSSFGAFPFVWKIEEMCLS